MGPNYSIRTRSRAKKPTRSSPKKPSKIKPKQTLITKTTTTQKPFIENDDEEFPKTQGTVFEANDNNNNANVSTSNSSANDMSFSNICSNSNGCSTPKGDKFRIPEIVNCPPAPKKRRVVESTNWSVKRSPIAFFAPPELELFFYFALRGISV